MSDRDASRLERQRIVDETANMLMDDLEFKLNRECALMTLRRGIAQAIERVRIYERGGEQYERR